MDVIDAEVKILLLLSMLNVFWPKHIWLSVCLFVW